MSIRRELLTGIIAALISITIIGGSLALATSEDRSSLAQIITNTPTRTSFPTHIILVTQRPGEPTYTPSPTKVPSLTPSPENVTCPQPVGWSSILLQPGDTLSSLAQTYNTTRKNLREGNCLNVNSLVPGTIFYVPGTPPPTAIPCGPPFGWVYYIVQSGDTLYSIGRAYQVSVAALQSANCLGSSTTIRPGQKLYVPNVKPILPSPTPTLSDTPTPLPSETQQPLPTNPTSTVILPSSTFTPIPTTPTVVTPSYTPIPTTIEPTLTFTPIPTTPTPVPTSTSSSTAVPTTPSSASLPTRTPVQNPTHTAVP